MLTRFGVVGDPIEHSLSPALHRAGYAFLGLPLSYDAMRVPAGSLAAFVASLGPEFGGLSVTAPLKREALALATRVSDAAATAGAANTLVREPDGWRCDNTDIPGAVAALGAHGVREVASAVILGAGATAASVGLALASMGVRRITLLARDPARALASLDALTGLAAGPDVRVGFLGDVPEGAGLVVSTVPAAAQTPELVSRLANVPACFDVVYDPWPTPLATAVSAAGGTVVDGLDLLVHQAVLQFEMFTGQSAPLAVMRAAGEAALAARTA